MLDGLQIVFLGARAVTDADWSYNLDVSRRHAASLRGVLVAGHPESPGITARQRSDGARMWHEIGVKPRIAVLTDSPLQRGIVTAVSWVTPGAIQAFPVSAWRSASGFAGALPQEASLIRIVLERLNALAWVPEYQCRFRWEKNSIAFWDNRSVQHYAASDYWPQHRVMERVTIIGDPPR